MEFPAMDVVDFLVDIVLITQLPKIKMADHRHLTHFVYLHLCQMERRVVVESIWAMNRVRLTAERLGHSLIAKTSLFLARAFSFQRHRFLSCIFFALIFHHPTNVFVISLRCKQGFPYWIMIYSNYVPHILKGNLRGIDVYEGQGGYQQLKNCMEMKPEHIVDTVKRSGLRGRGGAGFPTGLKWSFIAKPEGKPRYLACNGDESEPGTFKDRQIFEQNPHLLIEGCLIAAYALGLTACYIYIRGEYLKWIKMVEKAVAEAYQKKYVGKNILGSGFSTEIIIHRGAGAYICGEETGLINSIEGKRPYPRIKPPFPAQVGLWGCPTIINNVETLSNIPVIMQLGAEAYSKIGAPDHPGPLLYGISGHVNKPGVYELPTGMKITDLIHDVAGGVKDGKKVKAVIPGGSSMPILRGDQLDGVTMNTDSLKKAGTLIGTAGLIVMDEDTDIVEVVGRLSHFYHHESCGQCTPCREGTGWVELIYQKFLRNEATKRDIDLLLDICRQMEGKTICALADGAAWAYKFSIERFREEYEKHCQGNELQPGEWDYKTKAASGV
ncbi:hypothetical protein CHS0354_024023 [Potamilus streckersoni]|uniref:NADH dehydrogenase [ubiquinone] flavoprotein 1, mitochondrial n=1 Tax=Potamilus streckersoni TaxID=2493646 RepID=A0AAE0RZI0_9BIVA|nr:hypothetical protein CHS0354_024023 [Potamilus streckersoni]